MKWRKRGRERDGRREGWRIDGWMEERDRDRETDANDCSPK